SSSTAAITVNPALTIPLQPVSDTVNPGHSSPLSVTVAAGTAPYSYQWYRGISGDTSNPIPGATFSSYTATPASTTSYWVRVTDPPTSSAGPAVLDSYTATVTVVLTIVGQPAAALINSDQSDTLSVAVTGGTTPYSYQWYQVSGINGTTFPIPFANNS